MHRRRPSLTRPPAGAGAAALVGVGVALLAVAAPAPAQSAASTLDSVFTAEQAERGREVFSDACAQCHTTDRFTGDAFRPSWSRAPASTLFTVLRSQMPFDNPGSLDRDEYAAVMAYLFELNGLPAGDRELPASADSLRGVTIRFPATDAAGGSVPPPAPNP